MKSIINTQSMLGVSFWINLVRQRSPNVIVCPPPSAPRSSCRSSCPSATRPSSSPCKSTTATASRTCSTTSATRTTRTCSAAPPPHRCGCPAPRQAWSAPPACLQCPLCLAASMCGHDPGPECLGPPHFLAWLHSPSCAASSSTRPLSRSGRGSAPRMKPGTSPIQGVYHTHPYRWISADNLDYFSFKIFCVNCCLFTRARLARGQEGASHQINEHVHQRKVFVNL